MSRLPITPEVVGSKIRRLDEHPDWGGHDIDSGGGGGDNGGMETRIAKLETTVEYIQRDIVELKNSVNALRGDVAGIRTTDFRIIFGAIIAVALGLAGIMAKGFGWI